MPKFQTIAVWQQAEQLMQPTLIRLIDNIRKLLDQSDWKGSYEDVQVWPEGISDAVKTQVLQLRQQLESAAVDEAAEIEQSLAALPSPYPGHLLILQRGEETVKADLWEMCYQICFQNYDVVSGTSRSPEQPDRQEVEVDTGLFDELGEVDWDRLDEKAHRVVEQVFLNLPG